MKSKVVVVVSNVKCKVFIEETEDVDSVFDAFEMAFFGVTFNREQWEEKILELAKDIKSRRKPKSKVKRK